MLYSQGVALEDLAIPRRDGGPVESDARRIWRTFAANYHLFRGTPTRIWLDHALHEVFGIRERLAPESADRLFDRINASLARARIPAARAVRAIQHRGDRDDRVAARSAGAPREDSRQRMEGTRRHRVSPRSGRRSRVRGLRRQCRAPRRAHRRRHRHAGSGYLAAHRKRRAFFKTMGATSTDHGHPTAQTSDLPDGECERLFRKALDGAIDAGRGGSVSRPDADRDGADEPRRRPGDADPSGLVAQPQPAGVRALRPRQGRRHPDAHRLCPRAEAAARPLRQRAQA